MCGIAGHLSAGGADAALVHRMCDAIRHRGPDEDGYHHEPGAVLGMRRLSIIDVDHGHQPVYNEDRSVAVVFNGEIYNFQELRRALRAKGHAFITGSDTEVIAHLYEERGVDLVEDLRGFFAFALWDRSRGRLMLARDRVGKKPLYYRASSDGLLFGSELKTLLQDPGLRRDVDPGALDEYLTFGYIGAPRSILADVQKLPPAHVLIHERGSVRLQNYWDLRYTDKTNDSLEEAAQRVRGLVREATRARLVSERPIGAFLSGGIDSSMVVAAMAEHASGPVKTFCIGFEDEAFDERAYARIVAERFGTEHHELVVRPDPTDLEMLAWSYDEPFADSSALPTYYVSRLAREHVTVALNGDGGDESFGGYLRYAANVTAERLPSMPRLRGPMLRLLEALPPVQRRPVLARRGRHVVNLLSGSAFERYVAMMTYHDEAGKQSLYTDEARGRVSGLDSAAPLRAVWDLSAGWSLADRMLHLDVHTYLPGDLLVKVDLATMAHSLEGRSPLLDQGLMEYAVSLPPGHKVHGRTTKRVLKLAARGWLPDEVLDRPKMGFGVPIGRWLRHEWHDLAWDLLTDQTARDRGWFRPDAVRAILAEHAAGRDWSTRIWSLVQLELWCRTWLDDGPARPPEPERAGVEAR